jgi:hypothetical protein
MSDETPKQDFHAARRGSGSQVTNELSARDSLDSGHLYLAE